MALMSPEIGFITAPVNGFLTGCGRGPRRSFYRPMVKDVLDRIERRLKELGISAATASKQAGLSSDAIRNMRRAVENDDRKGVSTATILALAPILQTTASWLIEGVGGDTAARVRVLGYAGADTEGYVIQSDSDPVNETAPVPPGGTSESVALHLKGGSMRGIADDGSLIYFEHQENPPTPDMIGYPCVVELEDGQVLFKRLLRGTGPGLFDLESTVGDTLRDRRIRWAAEPTAIIPPRQARRIVRRPEEDQAA